MSAPERIWADCGNVPSEKDGLCQWQHWGDLTEYVRTDSAQPLGWRDMASAPKDSLLLAFGDGAMRLIFWEGGQWKQVGATIEAGWFVPTHWMPLSAPPAQAAP